ncbi:MAG: phosphoglycolate phosphatase [Gammaproteobacteria bacterium]|jgi:phosphoglycolate phosphatase|nr:phosphoglycolate phosphatase [Gammaproteobacteria bacterium]
MSIGPRPLSVLFDLDGTLVDTAPDMAFALNQLLAEHGRPSLAYESIRPQVSNGARGLLGLGFGIDVPHPDYDGLRQRFLDIYQRDLCVHSSLFDGMNEVLEALENDGIIWGIVTNKPGWLTTPLVQALGISERAACVVSGDTCARAKPHPMSLLHAADLLGLEVASCLYVGDAIRDVEAARAAGMRVVAAEYGYLEPETDPRHWGADALASHPLELLAIIGLRPHATY